MKGLKPLVYSILVIFVFACNDILDPRPAQFTISDIKIDTQIEEGTSLQNISLLYGYFNEIFHGGLEIPANFNSLDFGEGTLRIFAGINENGIQSSPMIYPFFDPFQMQVRLVAGTEIKVTPEFQYKSEAKFRLIDDFESTTLFTTDLDGDQETKIQLDEGIEFQGGLIELNRDHPFIEVSNNNGIRGFPVDGTPVFVELHYKCNVEFQVGLIGWSPTVAKTINYKISIRPKEDWNKIYINFTPEIRNSQLEFYQLVLKADHDESLNSSYIYLDNMKWLHL